MEKNNVNGSKRNGDNSHVVILRNGNYEVKCLDLGATIQSFTLTKSNGDTIDIVLGFQKQEEYIQTPTHFGMTMGRYANRIAHATFNLDGKQYEIEKNCLHKHSIHSGSVGICWHIWNHRLYEKDGNPCVEFSTISKAMDGNWPGNVFISCLYELMEDGKLSLTYKAKTDAPTYINLTNHSYFNLEGNSTKDVLDYRLWIDADRYVAVDKEGIPSGNCPRVQHTPFDFNEFHTIGSRIKASNGYDHTLIFPNFDTTIRKRAVLIDDNTRLKLSVYTDMPSMQLYTANSLHKNIIDKSGKPCMQYGAVCLEAQYFPDSPNHANFPSTRLNPNDEYQKTIIYQLSQF